MRFLRLIIPAALLAVFATLAPAPAAAQDWNLTVSQSEFGHVVGNPDAAIKLSAFVSYTCPHCAAYERASDAPMRLGYLGLGHVQLEVRPLIRNSVDLAAALLAECGPTDKFFDNHRAIIFAQDEWMAKATSTTQAQQQRWASGSVASRMRAIAADLDFYDIMERRGYSRSETDQCLSNEARAAEIATDSQAESARYNVPGTPSFLLNGQLLDDVHDWAGIERALNARLTPETD